MTLRSRLFAGAALAVALAATASAYYPWVHYTTCTAPFVPVPEKFDLSALYNKTIYFYVSDQGPVSMVAGDTFTAALSQIRFAGRTWNGVSTSDLRVAYGGLFTAGATQSAPHIEVTFEDLPPGLLALGGPKVRASAVATGPAGQFVPIVQSVVILNRDMSALASYRTGFFLTTVHEMGHALGLQHTQTSSVMSTEFTRASTKADVLGLDDTAGISWLYPNAGFAAQSGTVAGQVTSGGAGVHLASVVVLTPQGKAISALTNPDGTYRIDGVPPGQYFIYVHPLPPSVQSDLGPSEIVLPLDPDGRSIAAGDPFGAQFYPGVQDPQQAAQIPVAAGMTTANINFSVQARHTATLRSDDVQLSRIGGSQAGLRGHQQPVPVVSGRLGHGHRLQQSARERVDGFGCGRRGDGSSRRSPLLSGSQLPPGGLPVQPVLGQRTEAPGVLRQRRDVRAAIGSERREPEGAADLRGRAGRRRFGESRSGDHGHQPFDGNAGVL